MPQAPHSKPHLGVDLGLVGQDPGQEVHGHLVAVLEPELGGLGSRLLQERTSVAGDAGGQQANGPRHFVDVGDAGGINQFVLGVGVGVHAWKVGESCKGVSKRDVRY